MILKVCGITRLTDALHATKHGATAIGYVFWPRSPRYIDPQRAAEITAGLPAGVTVVGVFVNETIDRMCAVAAAAGIHVVQLHGDEPPAYGDALPYPIVRAVTLENVPDALGSWGSDTPLLLDAADRRRRGGTGQIVDWARASALARQCRLILAGGLTPENVAGAIETVQPYGVDVSTGVEEAPGVKDFDKVTRFLANARSAFERKQT